jgi:hypothetical protein
MELLALASVKALASVQALALASSPSSSSSSSSAQRTARPETCGRTCSPLGQLAPRIPAGANVLIFEIFSQKKTEGKMPILTQITANNAENYHKFGF